MKRHVSRREVAAGTVIVRARLTGAERGVEKGYTAPAVIVHPRYTPADRAGKDDTAVRHELHRAARRLGVTLEPLSADATERPSFRAIGPAAQLREFCCFCPWVRDWERIIATRVGFVASGSGDTSQAAERTLRADRREGGHRAAERDRAAVREHTPDPERVQLRAAADAFGLNWHDADTMGVLAETLRLHATGADPARLAQLRAALGI